jgi:hypothetical protein
MCASCFTWEIFGYVLPVGNEPYLAANLAARGSRVARALSLGDKVTARVHYEGEEKRNILRSDLLTTTV